MVGWDEGNETVLGWRDIIMLINPCSVKNSVLLSLVFIFSSLSNNNPTFPAKNLLISRLLSIVVLQCLAVSTKVMCSE